ncbi:HAMP domain-containing sensor histidine kinase [Bacteriovorax sp. PP10]|uniref:histidine kinase n=1 Tax=Bacteriovorax antarcticus TaxID=3088717 RepID=A0ABU5VR36_9BACT|nr:HAMP domain-containing sensor histidine kinase [Bacteriovorax sp. PP10]MEA9355510.1 HAMP domain-containing sensor histidine kinase [Bacteriovorax sp. PP10]
MLYEFLLKNQEEILNLTSKKTLELAGKRSSSTQLEAGLPIFFEQLLDVLLLEREEHKIYESENQKVRLKNKGLMVKAADESDETSLAESSGRPDEAELAKTAKRHGEELLRLGYTLSHVVHAYGAICQAITELAVIKDAKITANEFHDFNRCLDIAIAGAVTGFSSDQNLKEANREVEHLGFLAHELRNALTSVNLSFQLIKRGTVATGGSTAQLVDKGLSRIEYLIDRSLTEVRMKIDPRVIIETGYLLQLVDQIVTTASIESQIKHQSLEINIDPKIVIKADQQLFYSAISNLIQNAIKYTRIGGKIEIRGRIVEQNIVIDVEDECGGLLTANAADLFKPFEQQHKNKQGLGLGLTIAQKAIELNLGTIKAKNLPGKGCIFTITLPNHTM